VRDLTYRRSAAAAHLWSQCQSNRLARNSTPPWTAAPPSRFDRVHVTVCGDLLGSSSSLGNVKRTLLYLESLPTCTAKHPPGPPIMAMTCGGWGDARDCVRSATSFDSSLPPSSATVSRLLTALLYHTKPISRGTYRQCGETLCRGNSGPPFTTYDKVTRIGMLVSTSQFRTQRRNRSCFSPWDTTFLKL
jgi:hypothetical protein